MKKIQIVHFVETLEKGGLENVIYNIATNLDDRKFDVSVICRIEGGYTAHRLKEKGIKVQILNLEKISLFKINKILKKYKEANHAILHCHGLFATSSEAILGSLCDYKAVFVHVHNLEKPDKLRQWLKLKLLKKRVNNFIAVSEAVSNCLKNYKASNVKVIPNSISTKKFSFHAQSSEDKFGFPPENFLLGMVGRIELRKGYKQFVDIIENAKNINGVIVGEGVYEKDLKLMVKERNLNHKIKFLPFQSQDLLPQIYAKLDGFFLFSTKEGLPLALLESQAIGVPYIGNSVGGIKDAIKEGYNGFLIENIDIPYIINITKKIMGNSGFYRQNARRTVNQKYSQEKGIREIEKLYFESVN